MRTITAQVGPLAAASANNIAQSQTPGASGVFTLNGALVTGGVAVLDKPRRVLFTTVADESGKTITVVGTDWNGNRIVETLTGPNATTGYTTYDFKTVVSITASAAFTGAVTVGTNGIASSRPVRIDLDALPQIALAIDVTGTVNYTVQQTLDDPNDPGNPVAYQSIVWLDHADTALVAATASKQGNYGYAPSWVRLLLNSGSGTAVLKVNQSGGAP